MHECAPTEHVVEKRKESLKDWASELEKKLASGHEALQAISDVEKKLNSNAQKVRVNEQRKGTSEDKHIRCDLVDIAYSDTHKEITAQLHGIQPFVNEVKWLKMI